MSVNLYKNGDLIPIAGNGGGVEVDAELSAESENPVQNKAIDAKIKELESAIAQATTALNNLKQVAKTGSYNDLTDKPTIPTSLKNPQPLKFTGRSTVSYDGSSQQTVPIPTSLPASGGNADTVGNKHASDFVAKTGDTMTGNLTVNSGTVNGKGSDSGFEGEMKSGKVQAGEKAWICTSDEGGELTLVSPSGYGYQFDAYNGDLRIVLSTPTSSPDSGNAGNVSLVRKNKKCLCSPTDDCTVAFTTGDTTDANATSWTDVPQLTSGLTHAVLMERISQMMKNVRYLKKEIEKNNGGNADVGYISLLYTLRVSTQNISVPDGVLLLLGFRPNSNAGYVAFLTGYSGSSMGRRSLTIVKDSDFFTVTIHQNEGMIDLECFYSERNTFLIYRLLPDLDYM